MQRVNWLLLAYFICVLGIAGAMFGALFLVALYGACTIVEPNRIIVAIELGLCLFTCAMSGYGMYRWVRQNG